MLDSSKTQLNLGELPAPVTILTKVQCLCLLAALGDGRLVKRKGSWHAVQIGRLINGGTVADLVREGFLVFEVQNRTSGVVRLTPRGDWFARTLGSSPNARKRGEATPIARINDNRASSDL